MPRLSAHELSHVVAARPRYRPDDVSIGIVHLGLGAFARAHLAVFVDDLIAHGRHDLGILGVSLRNPDVPDALSDQDGLYTIGVVRDHDVSARVVGSVRSVLHGPSHDDEVRSALATVDIVSVTVTEKGYCWEPSTRRLDRNHADIVHDLAHPGTPRSLIGHLVRMASDRRSRGFGGATILSLDNLPANGSTLRSAVLDFAGAVDSTLASWVTDHLRFPCSMVDRLVPATDDGFRDEIERVIGCRDAWPVKCEPYVQWVVERSWAGPIPPFASVGVTFVDEVAPWETMKLRVLNGMHTAAAHFGLRHGLDTVDQVIAEPRGRALLARLAVEVLEVLDAPPGVDATAYVATTLARFSNRALGHRCAQIAADTSQKLPQRLLDTVRHRLELDLPIDALGDAIALWAWSTLGRDSRGMPRVVQDPMASRYAELSATHGAEPAALASALVGLTEIFGDLAGDERIAAIVADRLELLVG